MEQIAKLIASRRWVYWLNRVEPDGSGCHFRVCVVVENEGGYFPTGGPDGLPWYWDDEYCEEMNRRRGYDPAMVVSFIASSSRVVVFGGAFEKRLEGLIDEYKIGTSSVYDFALAQYIKECLRHACDQFGTVRNAAWPN